MEPSSLGLGGGYTELSDRMCISPHLKGINLPSAEVQDPPTPSWFSRALYLRGEEGWGGAWVAGRESRSSACK